MTIGKRTRRFFISRLTCLCCGNTFPIPRKAGSVRERNHIKSLWCVKCGKRTKHIENKKKEDMKAEENRHSPYDKEIDAETVQELESLFLNQSD